MKRIYSLFVLNILCCFSLSAQEPRIIAHRGFWQSKGACQNSIAALEQANRINIYGSEFDVHLTEDGVLVVFHDNKVNEIEIQQSPYAAVRDIVLSNGERIPTLREYLEAAKHTDIQLIFELKAHDSPRRNREAARASVELVREKRLQHRTTYITFNLDAGKELIRLAPEAEVYYLNGDLSPQALKETGFAGLDYQYNILKQNIHWLKDAKKLGLGINVWTVNDTVLMREMIDYGVDFITTDIPLDALKFISAMDKE
ncbi:MAG: glycerophosphodiester phosphodiesterase [Tannerella sp.]|jgi:glycerophosphoryl diester phosphodiesterase|nr:glycerophosphodiester phosphodiesterase [Tannerella sp.]